MNDRKTGRSWRTVMQALTEASGGKKVLVLFSNGACLQHSLSLANGITASLHADTVEYMKNPHRARITFKGVNSVDFMVLDEVTYQRVAGRLYSVVLVDHHLVESASTRLWDEYCRIKSGVTRS